MNENQTEVVKVAKQRWRSMMARCYNPAVIQKYPSYADCRVHIGWHNIENFVAWFVDNYYELPIKYVHKEPVCVDKDILIRGNRIYSSDTCLLVPQTINTLFRPHRKRWKYPLGVSYNEKEGAYSSRFSINGKIVARADGFPNPEDAFAFYKKHKEAYIKQVADKYQSHIPQKLYDALYAWEVEITD